MIQEFPAFLALIMIQDFPHLRNSDFEAQDEQLLTLSLSTTPTSLPSPLPPPPPSHSYSLPIDLPMSHRNSLNGNHRPPRPPRARGPSTQILKSGKSDIVPAPYPWATTRRAMVHTLDYLLSNGINTITGEVQCKRCEKQFELQYDLKEKFTELALFISNNKADMHHRAPPSWMNPSLSACIICKQPNCAKPIINKKRSINWLFLLLGEMLGCCKLSELKYFCKHTRNHRTGAKDRVLYLTYIELCKQLDPERLFDKSV
ncbi:hypothetical protein LguiB_035223 [Lonicera macranthoides]